MTTIRSIAVFFQKTPPWLKQHRIWCALAIIMVTLAVGPACVVYLLTGSERYSTHDIRHIPVRDTALVLGAGVTPDGQPTPYLKWRVQTAVELYKHGKVKRLLMSGDNSNTHYNEPVVMRLYAMSIGMADKDIILDYAGFNTYDSCYRAGKIFGVKRMTIVSQGYHVPRAVATCQALGADAIGVSAEHVGRDFTASYLIRELVATDKAVFQMVVKPQPTVGGNPVNPAY